MAAWLGLLGLTLSPQLRARLVTLTDAKRPTMCGVAPPGARDAPLIDAESAPFEAQLAALRAWREEIGHADVPLGSPLGRWVYTQRRLRQEGRMPADRAAALEAEGLRWTLDPDDVPWDEMMDRCAPDRFRTAPCAPTLCCTASAFSGCSGSCAQPKRPSPSCPSRQGSISPSLVEPSWNPPLPGAPRITLLPSCAPPSGSSPFGLSTGTDASRRSLCKIHF
jgi:hypothetical protein